jgi:hypothetical protein
MIFKGFITTIISIFLVVVIYATGESGIRHFYPPAPVPSPRPMDRSSFHSFFNKWNSRDVVKKFRESGLEAREMNAGYLMEPAHLKEATVFLIPSYGENVGGYISTYDADANLRESKSYYMKMNKNRKTPAWWIFEKDNILLLISGKVPQEIAGKYEHVLNNMSVE